MWQGASLLEGGLVLTIGGAFELPDVLQLLDRSESCGRARYLAHANGTAAGPYGDAEAAGYAPTGPQQQGGGGGYPGAHPGGHPGSAPHAQQLAHSAAQYSGSGGPRGGSAEAKRPLEGQYPGGTAGGRCQPPERLAAGSHDGACPNGPCCVAAGGAIMQLLTGYKGPHGHLQP